MHTAHFSHELLTSVALCTRVCAVLTHRWVVNGGGLHELTKAVVSDSTSHGLPRALAPAALERFPPETLANDVVWQPSGGALHNPAHTVWVAEQRARARAPKPKVAASSTSASPRAAPGAGAATAAAVAEPPPPPPPHPPSLGPEPPMFLTYAMADGEVEWLTARGVRWYNYTRLAMDYAALMSDGRHFTYYWAPCWQVFPQMTEVAARAVLHAAVDHPATAVCARAAAGGGTVGGGVWNSWSRLWSSS